MNIDIQVKTKYLGLQEKKDNLPVHVFSYTVTIVNHSDEAVTLRSRYWLITNGDGEKIEVKGDGVVGEQPKIKSTESYSYTSASMIKSDVGTMEGFYVFELEDKSTFKAPIPVFTLAKPNALH